MWKIGQYDKIVEMVYWSLTIKSTLLKLHVIIGPNTIHHLFYADRFILSVVGKVIDWIASLIISGVGILGSEVLTEILYS